MLTIVKELNNYESLALCDCGNEKIVKIHHMQTKFPNCGCSYRKQREDKAKKLEGTTYFKLKILSFLRMGEDKRARYLVKCKCGKQFEQSISYIFGSKSCGCLHNENVPRGSKNHWAKLTEVDVLSMRDLFKSGLYSRKDLANIYGIAYENTCSIIKRTSWKHI